MGGCIDYVQNKDEKLQNISDLSNGIPLDDDELSQDAIKFAYNDQTQTPICYSIMEASQSSYGYLFTE
ncbi:hypothetical protein SS50377_25111 [Spironucleus salmonicida]|uniref:Uncharacterized protein n=1 Tax=Spironucleus salmonicida TaxID=348837 RepID=V6LLX1_9EUKA|nr:hypothetical protein SS50377_25111 [Spironucleus salmonicida]|eukprot:EST44706.1 Hypothetical protein SS50377_15418 [Spironucleus salmonicida]